ncbi:Dynein assembly factor 5, axonemal [Schistosoma japonicum]|nr:Dynein assembly factor 5, axonemal [Schistosoma japonicum]
MSEGLCNISRCIILLTDEDRFTRKKALKSIESYLNTNDDKEISIYGTLAENLANALNDPVEVNRELAIKVLMLTINVTKDIRPLLPIIVPVIVMRLGQKEIIEQSEEIRYSTLNFIYILVTRTDETSPFLDDYISIIQKTLVDPYHEVKKLSCRIAIALSEKKCHRFYQVSESILMPMLSNLTHQHSKVRLETVVALEKVLMHSQGKLVDSVIPPLTQRLFDSSSAVRRAVIELVGSWLLDLPDRYSYQTRLLPLLLSGFIDESDEIHVITMNLWHHIGLKFEKENEENLKDKLDFDHNLPSYYPYGCKRPILGCRELVYRSASKLFPGLCKDLSDWQEATRLKSASLLPILILHLEESATQHTQHLLTGIANGLTDALSRMSPVGNISLINMMTFVSFRQVSPSNITVNELDIVGFIATHSTPQAFSSSDVNEAVKVINQLFISAQILGCMISTKFWWHLLEPCLHRCTESAAPSSLAGHLFLLSGLIYGSPLYQINGINEFHHNSSSSDCADVTTTSTNNTTGISPNVHNDNVDENNHVKVMACTTNHTTLHKIIAYLSQNELISVMSVGAKAGLLKCVQVSIEHLNEAIDLLKQDSKQQHEHALESLQLSDDSQRDIAETTYNSAKLLVQDEQIRSWLFEIILGLGGVWPENDLVSSDFGQTILSSCDRLMERLAVCHRDCINLSKQYHLSSKGSDVNEALVINSASTNDFDQLLFSCMPKLIHRLNEDLHKSISWHPRSIGLSLLSCCLQLATGPALLFTFNNHGNNQECLAAILDLLERGCRLNSAPGGGGSGVDNAGSQFDKSPGGTDPLTLASEAELRLRGLMLLTKLTDNNHIRTVLSSSKYLSYCFSKLILPVCVWRAGRTSEAMRKAACTSYLALLASAVSIRHLSEIILNSRTSSEIHIDQWLLTNNIESMHSVMQELTNNEFNNDENNAVRSTPKFSNLPCLPSSLLSLMLARLGSLLDDDLEGTRRLACLCLTIFFNGLLIPPPLPSSSTSSLVKLSSADQNHDENKVVDFLNSPTWIQSLTTNTTISSNSSASHEMPKECNILLPNVPLANSFGDQVFRFYGNFIKRLNDSKDQIRILICETIIAWIRLLIPMLTSSPSSATTIKASPQLNPVYSGVMEDFLNHLIIHLDDPSSQIRASVSRILLRINQFSSDLVIKALNKSRSCHRSFQLCDKLLEYCQSSHSHQYN